MADHEMFHVVVGQKTGVVFASTDASRASQKKSWVNGEKVVVKSFFSQSESDEFQASIVTPVRDSMFCPWVTCEGESCACKFN